MMHRYLVERTFTAEAGISLPGSDDLPETQTAFAANNAHEEVVWVCSYLSPDRAKSFCIYDAPNPESIRRASMRNSLPIDRITEVSVLSTELRARQEHPFADNLPAGQGVGDPSYPLTGK